MSSDTLNTTIVQSFVCFEVVYVKGVSVAQQLINDLEKRPAKDVYCSFKARVYMRCVVCI